MTDKMLPAFDEVPTTRTLNGYAEYKAADGGWIVQWEYRGYTFTQHYEEGDPVHTPPSARRRAAAAAASIADQYGLVLFRPPRRNGREE